MVHSIVSVSKTPTPVPVEPPPVNSRRRPSSKVLDETRVHSVPRHTRTHYKRSMSSILETLFQNWFTLFTYHPFHVKHLPVFCLLIGRSQGLFTPQDPPGQVTCLSHEGPFVTLIPAPIRVLSVLFRWKTVREPSGRVQLTPTRETVCLFVFVGKTLTFIVLYFAKTSLLAFRLRSQKSDCPCTAL